MRSLISLLATCLVAASAAADQPANQAAAPWPPDSRDTSSDAGPKITEYGPAATRQAAPGGPRVTAQDSAGPSVEAAPDPPVLRHPDVVQAVYQQDSPPAAAHAERPADGPLKQALEGVRRANAAWPASTAAAPAPAAFQQPSAAPPAAGGGPPAAAPSTLPTSSAPVGQRTPAWSLGLGGRGDKNSLASRSPLSAVVTVGGSLAIVLGVFFVIAWAMRKAAPRGSLPLPKEVFEILGRAPLAARLQVQLVRCGNKLLLLSVRADSAETLTEVTDPLEVERIAGLCRQAHPKGGGMPFRQIFQQLVPAADEASQAGDAGEAAPRRKRYRWEENHA